MADWSYPPGPRSTSSTSSRHRSHRVPPMRSVSRTTSALPRSPDHSRSHATLDGLRPSIGRAEVISHGSDPWRACSLSTTTGSCADSWATSPSPWATSTARAAAARSASRCRSRKRRRRSRCPMLDGDGRIVLLIEGEPPIRRLLRTELAAYGYRLIESSTGEAGFRQAVTRLPDLIILDLGLPDVDGMEVIRRLREWSALPIIVLSARCQERDMIDALDAGADDYVSKPFRL